MKVIGLVGSPHGTRGNTGRLLEILMQAAAARGAEIETIALRWQKVRPCLACDACHQKGECPQDDEFETIRRKIHAADALVLASPNYIFSVSAQMKAFMDRCSGVIHCLAFEGKYGASVVTSGGGDEAPIADYMNHFLLTTGIVPVGSVWATMGSLPDGNLPDPVRDEARRLGERLVDAWEKRERPAEVDAKIRAFSERMRALIAYRKDEWPHEYDYWRRNRGL